MRDLISREVKTTLVRVKVFKHSSSQVLELDKELYKVVTEADKIKNELAKQLGSDFTVLEVLTITPKSVMMGMSVEEFATLAHVLDDKRRYVD